MSVDAPSNYPNFLDLATELGGTAYPIRDHELIDLRTKPPYIKLRH